MEKYYKLRKAQEVELIKKAHNDKEFEKLLLTDPRAALKEFGVDVPNEVPIEIIEESGNNIRYVHLHHKSDTAEVIVLGHGHEKDPEGTKIF